jgi:hypothetical protein
VTLNAKSIGSIACPKPEKDGIMPPDTDRICIVKGYDGLWLVNPEQGQPDMEITDANKADFQMTEQELQRVRAVFGPDPTPEQEAFLNASAVKIAHNLVAYAENPNTCPSVQSKVDSVILRYVKDLLRQQGVKAADGKIVFNHESGYVPMSPEFAGRQEVAPLLNDGSSRVIKFEPTCITKEQGE